MKKILSPKVIWSPNATHDKVMSSYPILGEHDVKSMPRLIYVPSLCKFEYEKKSENIIGLVRNTKNVKDILKSN